MNTIKRFFARVVAWFKAGDAERDFNRALAIIPQVAPVVEAIAAAAPNKTMAEIRAAYDQYAVPISAQLLTAEGLNRGLLLMELATKVLTALVPMSIPTRILQLAIQVVYTAIKARK